MEFYEMPKVPKMSKMPKVVEFYLFHKKIFQVRIPDDIIKL